MIRQKIVQRHREEPESNGMVCVKATNVACVLGEVQDTLAGVREELAGLRAERGLRLRRHE